MLREPMDHPAQLSAGQIANSISGGIMEAGVARLESESNIGPGNIQVDPLARSEIERVLCGGCGESRPMEGIEQVAFEVALRRPVSMDRALDPTRDESDAVLAAAPVSLQIVGHRCRGDKAEIPGIIGNVVEPTLCERRRRESEQRSPGVSYGQSRIEVCEALIVEVPAAAMDIDPRGNLGNAARRDEALDWVGTHSGQTVQASGRLPGENAAAVEPHVHSKTPGVKRLRRRRHEEHSREQSGEPAVSMGAIDATLRETLVNQLASRDDAVLGASEMKDGLVEHTSAVGSQTEKPERTRKM